MLGSPARFHRIISNSFVAGRGGNLRVYDNFVLSYREWYGGWCLQTFKSTTHPTILQTGFIETFEHVMLE